MTPTKPADRHVHELPLTEPMRAREQQQSDELLARIVRAKRGEKK